MFIWGYLSSQVLYCLVVSYLYTDYWPWMLHCFLDRKENLDSRIGVIATLAREFQVPPSPSIVASLLMRLRGCAMLWLLG